jgi:hypothetical protein
MYKLPLGIKIPQNEEYPVGSNVEKINNQRDSANIMEGFTFKKVIGEKYSYYVEINVNADKLWDVFCALSNKLINNSAYGVIGFKEEKPTLSNFTSIEKIIKILEKYKYELLNDGYLEFGIASYNDKEMNEIFVSSFKYIKVWTPNIVLLTETLKEFGIRQIENLQFIDEFPVVSEALAVNIEKGIRNYTEVIESIEKQFEIL